jgi:hypothetical protein
MSEKTARASDCRPSRQDLDALLACTSLTTKTRDTVLDALADAALLQGTRRADAARCDCYGRLSTADVDNALGAFEVAVRTQVKSTLLNVNGLIR